MMSSLAFVGDTHPNGSDTQGSLVARGADMKKYAKLSFNPSAAPALIPKRFKIPYAPRCDGTADPHEHMAAYMIGINGNDLQQDNIESAMLKIIWPNAHKGSFNLLYTFSRTLY